jgi:hypothetical protein
MKKDIISITELSADLSLNSHRLSYIAGVLYGLTIAEKALYQFDLYKDFDSAKKSAIKLLNKEQETILADVDAINQKAPL